MKALLILALAMQGSVNGELAAESRIVKIYLSQREELDARPRMVALQSLRMARGEYFLLIEVNSWEWQVPQQCQLFLTVDRKPLTLPCFVQSSTTVSPGRPLHESRDGDYITQHLVINSKKLPSVLRAKSVEMRVGFYKVRLSDNQLRQLSSVVQMAKSSRR